MKVEAVCASKAAMATIIVSCIDNPLEITIFEENLTVQDHPTEVSPLQRVISPLKG